MTNVSVLSLINANERRQHIDMLFKEYRLDFEYFDAINKQQVIEVLEQHGLKVNSKMISEVEIACYLSHYCLWQKVLDNNLSYLIVFEDDIYFSKNAKVILNDLSWLPNSFDAIKLETMYDRVVINKGKKISLGHTLCQMQSRHMGMAGYIISRQGAHKLLSMTRELGIDRPVDHVMFDELINSKNSSVHQVVPALCIQDKIYNKDLIRFESVLESERQPFQIVKKKPSGFKRVSKEITRVAAQLLPNNLYSTGWLFIKGYKKQKITYSE